MGYAIWLEMDTGGPEPVGVSEHIDHTSNCSPMWADAIGYNLADLDRRIAGECIDDLQKAVQLMERNPGHYLEMEPENRWGSYESALGFLRDFLRICQESPRATIVIIR